jgi:RNA polymerase sigma factor (sigma-70 family)
MDIAPTGTLPADISRLPGAETGLPVSDRVLLERFVGKRDETAFVNLLQRHSRSVWGVCRRLLGHEQDAEDAFQAVFFVLARKAASIRKGEALGSWLYGVAYRTAMQARQLACRRSQREKKASTPRPEEAPPNEAAWQELQRHLDEELQRLADKYRAPFVLCCLEGMSRAEAAKELGWKEGTVSSRLAHARKLLQQRLERRGVLLTAVLTAGALAQNFASAAAPATLVQTAAHAALVPGAVTLSPSAAALAHTALGTMAIPKLMKAMAVIAVLTMFSGGAIQTACFQGNQGEAEAENVAVVESFLPPPFSVQPLIDEQILALAFYPDGKKVVTVGARHTQPGQLKIWDVPTGNELAKVRGFSSGARAVAVAPDGKTFATGHFNGSIVLRHSATGEEQSSVHAHAIGVNGLAYSKDGDRIVSAGLDNTVKVWNVNGLKEQQVLRGHTGMVYSVAYFRHGKAVVSGGKDGTAILWDLGTGKSKHVLRGHGAPIEMVAISPDDQIVATASWDQTIKLWDAETGTEKGALTGSGSLVLAAAFSPDGEQLASANSAGEVQLWEVKTRTRIKTLGIHFGPVWSVAFSRDGNLLASGSSDKTAKIWDVAKRRQIAVFQSSEIRPVRAVAYAPDAKAVAVAGDDRAVRLLDPRSGKLLGTLKGHADVVTCLAFSPDGQSLATGGLDSALKLWDYKSGKERWALKSHTGAVLAVAFTADGKMIASAGDDKLIRIWNPESGQELATVKGGTATVRSLAFAADGITLARGSDDGTIQLTYFDNKTEPVTLNAHGGSVRALAFSGPRLASGGDDRTLKIWTAAGSVWKPPVDQKPLLLTRHIGAVLALAFTPRGSSLVSSGGDGLVIVWDTAAGQTRAILSGHKAAVNALAVHPLGDNLISGGADGALLRWRGARQALAADPGPALNPPDPKLPTNGPGRQQGRLPVSPIPATQPPGIVSAKTAGEGGWLGASLCIGFAVVLLLAAGTGVGFYVRRQPHRTMPTPAEGAPGPPIDIVCQCSACHRKLKVKAGLAGKYIKCPCGAPVGVPPPAPASSAQAGENQRCPATVQRIEAGVVLLPLLLLASLALGIALVLSFL